MPRPARFELEKQKNPGPRPAKSRHAFSLEEVNTVSAATLAIESRVLQQFFAWCTASTGDANFKDVFTKVPAALPHCLLCYGDLLFHRGGSLFNFRHLLLAAQLWCQGAKPFMQVAWAGGSFDSVCHGCGDAVHPSSSSSRKEKKTQKREGEANCGSFENILAAGPFQMDAGQCRADGCLASFAAAVSHATTLQFLTRCLKLFISVEGRCCLREPT